MQCVSLFTAFGGVFESPVQVACQKKKVCAEHSLLSKSQKCLAHETSQVCDFRVLVSAGCWTSVWFWSQAEICWRERDVTGAELFAESHCGSTARGLLVFSAMFHTLNMSALSEKSLCLWWKTTSWLQLGVSCQQI